MPEVSVIVPVYNVELYLEKCLRSLVEQSLEDIEILVINDGSTDKSQNIIDEYQRNYPKKIKSFQKPNGGLSDARNFGLDRASGEMIGFVDSDDYVSPTMFEEMYHLAKKHNAEMVLCNLQKVDEFGNVTQKLTQIPHLPEKIDLSENFSVFSDISYFACNKLFRKEFFQGKRFKKDIHFEDIQLIPQLLLQCSTVAHTQNYHYQYLERSSSISKTHNERGLDILNAVEDVKTMFDQSGFKNRQREWKGFVILEGVYTFLAYLVFVKDEETYSDMSGRLKNFMKNNGIKLSDILWYQRFDKNYLLSLPNRKKIYYLLYFFGQEKLIRKII